MSRTRSSNNLEFVICHLEFIQPLDAEQANKSSEIQGAEGVRGVLEPVLGEAKKFLGQGLLFIFLPACRQAGLGVQRGRERE